MNQRQQQLLNIIQTRFPITARPYAMLAEQIGADENQVMADIEQLRESGVIRRIGAIFDAAHLHHVSTLVAAHVPQERIDAFVSAVNDLPGVSHNYGRRHDYNIWFTLTMPNHGMIDAVVADLKTQFDLAHIYSLPAQKLYKIRVDFDFSADGNTNGPGEATPHDKRASNPDAATLSQDEINLVRQLQEDLAGGMTPFQTVADTIGVERRCVLDTIARWKETGIIRRFGASIRHQRAGFSVNGMVVFSIQPERLDRVGAELADYRQVSHCYHRPTAPNWPYNLFAMTHCRTPVELDAVVDQMVETAQPQEYNVLLTTREYKKTNVKYFME